MKKVVIVGLVAVLVLCIAVQSVSAVPTSARVRGYITDEGGNPIEGALVEWKNNATDIFLTSKNTTSTGYYSMTYTFSGTIESLIVASKSCYCTNSTVINIEASLMPDWTDVDLTLANDTESPVITNLQPPDGSFINDSTPTICANYSDSTGINISSVTMKVDGDEVTEIVTATGVCYTPTVNLPEGLRSVIVNVSDICGNPNSTSWSFTIDTVPPTIEFIPPTPANESTNTTGYVNVTVEVTDPTPGSGLNDIVNVSIWDEIGIYLDNETMFDFDDHKYYYDVSLPNGNYTYKVYAKDIAGNMNVSETRVITVDVTEIVNVALKSDWNMFGVPLNVSDWTLAAVLSSIDEKYDYISYYNAISEVMEYYDPLDPDGSTLNTLEPGAGYLIEMSEDATASFEGTKLMGLERSLKTDWNMFSVPYGVVDKTLPTVLSSIDEKYDYISYYNASSELMEYYDPLDPDGSTLNTLEPGVGYLIEMSEDAIYIPDMSL